MDEMDPLRQEEESLVLYLTVLIVREELRLEGHVDVPALDPVQVLLGHLCLEGLELLYAMLLVQERHQVVGALHVVDGVHLKKKKRKKM